MHRAKAKLGILATAALTLVVMAATSTSALADKGKLQVWINGDKAYKGLEEIGKRFTKETGIPVVVEHPEDAPGKFQQAAAAGKGPDIMIWPHDRAGEWVASGLIEPVNPNRKIQGQFEKIGWEAFTFDGRLWGYPISIEAIGLIYNKKLVPTPPKTFESIFALNTKLAKDNKRAILWDYKNTYFTWPLLAANGGYPFGRAKGGNYNAADVGVNNKGALAGAEMLVKLITSGVMPKGVDYAVMEAAMNKGEAAMMINGPWAWANLRKNNIEFGVAPIPSINGKPSKPFIGVLGAMVNRASPNKELAVEFLENYVLTMQGLETMDKDVSLGVPAHKQFYRKRASDPLIQATMKNIRQGVLMPSLPEMGRFWSAMASALENITQGRQPAKEALDNAARRILAK